MPWMALVAWSILKVFIYMIVHQDHGTDFFLDFPLPLSRSILSNIRYPSSQINSLCMNTKAYTLKNLLNLNNGIKNLDVHRKLTQEECKRNLNEFPFKFGWILPDVHLWFLLRYACLVWIELWSMRPLMFMVICHFLAVCHIIY